jgi:hypothetical protein
MILAPTLRPTLATTFMWDPTLSPAGQLFTRCWIACTKTRLRRYTLLPIVIQTVLMTVALTVPGFAHAAIAIENPLISMIGIKDSYGVPVGNYAISTDYGTVFDGGTKAVMGSLLDAEAGIFVTIGGFGIWFIIYVLSLGFLPVIVEPVVTVAQDYAHHILPGVFACAGLIAAAMITFNILKENFARATMMAATSVVVAVVFGALAYAPITWAISTDGPLMRGRDVAISLGTDSAASSANTTDTLNKLEGTLATSFIRHGLQALNFGGLPDDTPACAQAWSAGAMSDDSDQIKDGIAACGAANSASMKATADNPSPGQIGSGFMLLVFITIFAVFCCVLAFHIIGEFFNAVIAGLKFGWDLAVGVIPAMTGSAINSFLAVNLGFAAMFGYVTATIVTGQVVTAVFSTHGSGIDAMLSILVFMVIVVRNVGAIPRGLRRGAANAAANMVNAINGPTPAPVNNIVEERAGSFLQSSSAAVVGVGATMAGQQLARRAPDAAHALNLVAPVLGNRTLRHVNRGTHLQYDLDDQDHGNGPGPKPSPSNGPGPSSPPPPPPPGPPPAPSSPPPATQANPAPAPAAPATTAAAAAPPSTQPVTNPATTAGPAITNPLPPLATAPTTTNGAPVGSTPGGPPRPTAPRTGTSTHEMPAIPEPQPAPAPAAHPPQENPASPATTSAPAPPSPFAMPGPRSQPAPPAPPLNSAPAPLPPAPDLADPASTSHDTRHRDQ